MIEYIEVKQTPWESLKTTYWFLCEDLKEGLVYGVGKEVVEQAQAVILDTLEERVILDSTNSRLFCESLWPYLKRMEGVLECHE